MSLLTAIIAASGGGSRSSSPAPSIPVYSDNATAFFPSFTPSEMTGGKEMILLRIPTSPDPPFSTQMAFDLLLRQTTNSNFDQTYLFDWATLNGGIYTGVPSFEEAVPPGYAIDPAAVLYDGDIENVRYQDCGRGYTSPPSVTIAAPGSGVTATATATLTSGHVTGFTITNAGSGYTVAPSVTIGAAPGGGITALATSVIGSGLVTAINLTKTSLSNLHGGDQTSPVGIGYDYHSARDMGNPPGNYALSWSGGHNLAGQKIDFNSPHGRNYNDIGIPFTNGGYTWYIVDVQSTTRLLMFPENTTQEGALGIIYGNIDIVGTTFVYAGDGLDANTGNIVFDTLVTDGVATNAPSFSSALADTHWYLNGAEISTDAQIFSTDVRSFQMTQKIDYYDPWSAIAAIVANRPSGPGYTLPPIFRQGDVWFSKYMIFDFQDNGLVVVYSGMKLLRKIRIRQYGPQQNYWPFGTPWAAPAWLDEVIRRIPSGLPVIGGTYDFRVGESLKTHQISADTFFDSSKWEDGEPTLRFFDSYQGVLNGKTFDMVYNMGHIPIEDAVNIAANSTAPIEIFGTNKIYSYVLFDTSIPMFPPDTIFKSVMYRGMIPKPTQTGVINDVRPKNVYGTDWVFMDFDTIGTYDLNTPNNKEFVQFRLKNCSVSGDVITVTNTYAHLEGYFDVIGREHESIAYSDEYI